MSDQKHGYIARFSATCGTRALPGFAPKRHSYKSKSRFLDSAKSFALRVILLRSE